MSNADDTSCWRCRIALWIIFSAANLSLVYFTGGIGALFPGAVTGAIATALGVGVATVQRVAGQLVAGATIDTIVVAICNAADLCTD